MSALAIFGLLLTLLGCITLYLTSPHQRWLAVSWEARRARILGGLLLLAGLTALWLEMQPAAAVFLFVTGTMLFWVLLPYLGGLLVLRRGQ